MHRRHFLAAASLGLATRLHAASPKMETAALRADLEALSLIGRPPGGTFSSGVSRIGYSDADIAGRQFLMDRMRAAGAAIRIDTAGNIFASRPGADSSLPPLLFGSHADSVPQGGNFDGCLGSLAAIRILQTLKEANLVTRRPLTAVVWACEELSFSGAGLNGSRAAAGLLRPKELEQVSRGLTKAEAIRRIGGNPDRIADCRIARGAYHGYLELHIEQGGTLERDGIPIGVVDGIVSLDDYEVVIQGAPNHAGTTPMPARQDALVAASLLTLAVREIVMAEPGAQVGTVGHVEVSPNAANVIPGQVRLTIDLRDLSAAKIERLGEKIRSRAAAIATESKTKIEITRTGHSDAAVAAPEFQRAIEASARKLGLPFKHLPSGAGHDAQIMATLMPMGMIFVPSIAGISHSPRELTSWQDCANGANVLLETVLTLANAE